MLYRNRERFEKLSVKIGIAFSKIPFSANAWTLISILPAIAAFWFIFQQQFVFAAVSLIVAAFLDFVDGSVARVTGTVSKFGAFLDTIVDRYIEAIIVFALLFVSLPFFFIPAVAWLFLYFFGAMMTTYVKAAAKEKELVEKELKGGLLERAERMILLFAGIIAASIDLSFLVYVIAFLAVLSNFTALQRIWIAKKSA
ncbi:MAG: CDP-alcohol phosphatidyltransferase family protein [Candidatus Diapherotrites archaeon]